MFRMTKSTCGSSADCPVTSTKRSASRATSRRTVHCSSRGKPVRGMSVPAKSKNRTASRIFGCNTIIHHERKRGAHPRALISLHAVRRLFLVKRAEGEGNGHERLPGMRCQLLLAPDELSHLSGRHVDLEHILPFIEHEC